MQWYIWGMLAGLAVPWITMGKFIREAFETSSQAGLGAWLGASLIAVPVMEAIMFGFHLIASLVESYLGLD
jgi:hypothetical protein